ncbi:flagellar hook-basal body complex protein [Butyricicoccus faecihominis]|uniref:flagellar hook-basal body complex protein n=1 Tax=Butyricicoccus faecihominis TaxID=1712515 RepID=UPI0024796BF5|nr:flagellar hook-basal body complex protein [Butyricicoccus faecihominis]MCQ5130664.1 flagellar hook-basal body complex protein [Butyricicoccus faecihominis]
MNRAMFSGVAGMKAHQTKMDVIGNNIANVNTYGYKSQRAVFSDIYYQTLRGASSGSSSRGGVNPSSVGYGSTLNAVQTQMTQSSMQNTGFGMDVAITGEGFLQVMDPDGNIFYTKAGMLDYDSNGYLTDINGNFVLGATNVDGKPGTKKIKLDNIGSVNSKQPEDTQEINGVKYTVKSSNASKYGNVSFTLGASESLPAGQRAHATISPNGAVTVQLNAFESFTSMADLNSAVNAAIVEANGGKQLAAGSFTISADKNLFGTSSTNGTFTGNAFKQAATLTAGSSFFQGLSIKDINIPQGIGDAQYNFEVTYNAADSNPYTIKATFGGMTYEGKFKPSDTGITMKPASGDGSISLSVTDAAKFRDALSPFNANPAQTLIKQADGTPPKFFMGGASISVSNNFAGQGALTFECTNISADGKIDVTAKTASGKTYKCTGASFGSTVTLSTGSDADGTISLSIPSKDTMLKNFGVAEAGLNTAIQNSLGHHNYSAVPAQDAVTEARTGAEIAGGTFDVTGGKVTGTGANNLFGGLMTFQKSSNDFSGEGTVNNVTATFTDNGTDAPFWTVAMSLGGKTYEAKIDENTTAASILMKSSSGDYLQFTNPGYDALGELSKTQNGADAADGSKAEGLTGGQELDITAAEPSRDLGLGTTSFALVGGTEGGSISLDQLASISIGSDGIITVNHAEKGTVAAGKISLATFSNPAGLQLVGNNYYTTTANSGDAKLADPGSSGTGALKSSALEMSNVDLSSEFADMITTQRGFQANSRVITVSDTMLEELINLKR